MISFLLLHCLAAVGVVAHAQTAATVSISGKVYDPRTTASALPLPNVEVYVTTQAVDALPAGVQCLTTASTPINAVAYTSTDVTGAYTLTGVPANTAYTLVIQAGKWRRQFPLTVAGTDQTAIDVHMPSNHLQGDIPMIAISTGSVDGLECVLKDMGIATTEFSDDILDPTFTNARIHLYKGMSSAGSQISSTTPSETTLIDSASLLNNYDVIMFPCQGIPAAKNAARLNNVLGYANAGGRIFTTHYSYDWLVNNTTYNSPFTSTNAAGVTSGVANWSPVQGNPTPDPGVAAVNTGFSEGSLLADWLHYIKADYNLNHGQVQVSTLRRDTTGVIAPTQAWLALGTTFSASNPIMQLTFNTPVGADASKQCGRVLFNEYHVMNSNGNSGKNFPSACSSTGVMSAQEQMLEYALFDLSTFVQPVVIPELSLSFAPSPLVVNQGDAADTVTISTNNTSSTTSIDASAVFSLALPTGLTASSLTDATGGWTCTLSSLSCTRSTSLASGATDAVVLTVSVPSYAVSGLTNYTDTITATVASPTFSSNVVATDQVIFQQTPVISWPAPVSIIYGTPLSSTQLNATAAVNGVSLAGTFVYSPDFGAVLSTGVHSLNTSFTPTDAVHYTTATGANSITILPATPVVNLSTSQASIFVSNPVTFTAAVVSLGTIIPTGSVSFYDGSTLLGTGVMNSSGVATLSTMALGTGSHSITATYTGDTIYTTSTSSPLIQLVDDFTIAVLGSTSTTLGLGQGTTFPVVVAPVLEGTLSGPISFVITGLPPLTSAALTPTGLGSGAQAATLSLLVSMANSFAGNRNAAPWGALPVALGLALLPLVGLRRIGKARRWLVLGIVAAGLSLGLTACSFQYTPHGSTVTVTATSGNLVHTTTVTVTVK